MLIGGSCWLSTLSFQIGVFSWGWGLRGKEGGGGGVWFEEKCLLRGQMGSKLNVEPGWPLVSIFPVKHCSMVQWGGYWSVHTGWVISPLRICFLFCKIEIIRVLSSKSLYWQLNNIYAASQKVVQTQKLPGSHTYSVEPWTNYLFTFV